VRPDVCLMVQEIRNCLFIVSGHSQQKNVGKIGRSALDDLPIGEISAFF
jgi:hypothetical protein